MADTNVLLFPTPVDHNSAEAKRARQALYLEWLALPRESRDPRTKTEMAAKLGCTIQTLISYEKDPAFCNEVSRRLGMTFKVDRLSQVFEALYQTATDVTSKSQVAASRTILEWFDKTQAVTATDFSEMTDEQLRAALANG
jgi:DNA-binding XRE family transcriptional regulator